MSEVEEKREEKKTCECVKEESEKCVTCETTVEQVNAVIIEAPKAETYPIIIPSEKKDMPSNNKRKAEETPAQPKEDKVEQEPDETIAPAEKRPHYGEHSVVPTDVLQVNPRQCGVKVGQDIIRVLAAHLETITRRCEWRTPHFVCNFSDMVTWYRPYMTPQDWPITSYVYWMIPQADEHVSTTIVEVNPRVKTEFLPENYVGVSQNGAPDLSAVMRTIRGGSGLSKPIAEKILHKLRENGKVTDLSGFFCCGHLFAAHLDFLGEAAVQNVVWNAIPGNTLIHANIGAEGDAVGNAVTAIETHLSKQLLAFKWDSLTEQDRQVLISIAMGGVSSLGLPAGLNVVPVTSYITWPARQYFVWSEHPIVLPVNRVVLTGAQVRCSLAAFATLLDAHDDNASGFVKCSTILVAYSTQWNMPAAAPAQGEAAAPQMPANVRMWLDNAASYNRTDLSTMMRDAANLLHAIEPANDEPSDIPGMDSLRSLIAALNPPAPPKVTPPPTRVRGALIHALLEAKQIMVQQPRGHNFLWDVLGYKRPTAAVDSRLVDDGLALGAMDSDLQLRTCFFIGGLLSVAAGVVLHGVNVTGRELNNFIAGGGDSISSQLRQWFQVTKGGTVAPFYQLVVGALQQLTSVKISPSFASQCSIWCGDRAAWEDIDRDNSWFRSVWAQRIPYIVEPLSMAWVYLSFCDLWGYFGIRPRVNFSHDLVVGGPADQEYISFHRDESMYMASASLPVPYRYIPYGIIMLNIMRQYFNAVGRWPISIRLIRIVKAGSGEIEPPVDDIFQPQPIPNLPWYRAGTMLSYSHELQCVIVPGLTRMAINPGNFYVLLRMGDTVLEGVGVQRDGIVGQDAAPVGSLALLDGLVGLDMDDAAASTSKKTEN